MNGTVINNNYPDVWTLKKESGGKIHHATFRWIKEATTSLEFTIEFNHNPIWVTVKTAREEWNLLVEAGWTRSD
tara:strand:+ start:1853 stop:2074 length:222 start_codon:yes stop_codon:yes gene_type:complete